MKNPLIIFGAAATLLFLVSCKTNGPVSVLPETSGVSVNQDAVEAQRAQTQSDVNTISNTLLQLGVVIDSLG